MMTDDEAEESQSRKPVQRVHNKSLKDNAKMRRYNQSKLRSAPMYLQATLHLDISALISCGHVHERESLMVCSK